MTHLAAFGLSACAAVFYVAATYVLKVWTALPSVLAVTCLVTALAIACTIEVELLRRARFGDVVLLMILCEVLLAMVLSHMILGESWSRREALGLVVMVVGLAMFVSGAPRAEEPPLRVAEARAP